MGTIHKAVSVGKMQICHKVAKVAGKVKQKIALQTSQAQLVSKKRRYRGHMQRNRRSQTCEICCHTVTASAAVRLPCLHGWYCDDCVLKYCEAQLRDGVLQITCPECRDPIHEHVLRSIVPHSVLDRLLEHSLEQAVAASSDLVACPTPDCPMRVALHEGDKINFSCQVCCKTSCLRCRKQPYHLGMTCEAAADSASSVAEPDNGESCLFQWMAATGTKQCPKCRMPVSKENLHNQTTQRSECHKMWCRCCGTRVCFKCLAVLTRNYSCGCTKDIHSFVNPYTGRNVKA